MKARVATTFDELRETRGGFAKVLGTDAARTMILAVTALSGQTLAEVGTALRSLPGFRLAQVQLVEQGGHPWAAAGEHVLSYDLLLRGRDSEHPL